MQLPARLHRGLAGLAFVAVAVACGPAQEPTGTSEVAPAATPAAGAPPAAAPTAGAPSGAALAEAEQIFATRCATCHGPEGRGDGPVSVGLDPSPRNLQDAAWQESVSDTHIENIIQYGGAAVGRSPAMPANPDLTGKPEVVAALRAHVRGLGAGSTARGEE